MTVLVTGAAGFIGSSLIGGLLEREFSVLAMVRHNNNALPSEVRKITVPDLSEVKDWQPILQNIEVIIHTAGRAHIMNEKGTDSLAKFRKINTFATIELAKHAVDHGVKRFIFISSIGVNGSNIASHSEIDPPNPKEPYAISKLEAERGLLDVARETNLEVVVIRPPLVYGVNASGNFGRLITWVNKGVPLPFGAIYNQRSLIALDNLVSFIVHCIDHPKAANEVFLISDAEDVSTTELLKKVSNAFGKKSLLFPVPVNFMMRFAKLLGKSDVANRLFSSLQVDSSKARDLLGWNPVITMDEQLKKIVEGVK